jgi:hypothetical protein
MIRRSRGVFEPVLGPVFSQILTPIFGTTSTTPVGPDDRVLFSGHELKFNGMTVVHSGGDGVNTLTLTAGTGATLTSTETLITLDAT